MATIPELAGIQLPGVNYQSNWRPTGSDQENPDPYGEGQYFAGLLDAGYMPLSETGAGNERLFVGGAGYTPKDLQYLNSTYGLNLQNSTDYFRHIYGQPNAEVVQDDKFGPLLKIGKGAQVTNPLNYEPNPNEELMQAIAVAGAAFGGAGMLAGAGMLGAGGGMAGLGSGAAGTIAGEVGAGAGGLMGAGGATSAGGSLFSGFSNPFSGMTNPFSSITDMFTKGAGSLDAAGAPAMDVGGTSMLDDFAGYWNPSDYGASFVDNWDVMGNLGSYGLDSSYLPGSSTVGETFADNWDLMGDKSKYGLGKPDNSVMSYLQKLFGQTSTGGKGGTGGTGGTDPNSTEGIIARLLSGAGGLFDMFSHSPLSARGITERASMIADPAQKHRPIYGDTLMKYLMEPDSYNLSPAAQFQLKTGTENLTRSNAARGLLGSGNILGELQKFGQGVASQDYWKAVENMGRLSGGLTGDMATAGKISQGYYDQRNNAMANVGGAIAPPAQKSTVGIGDVIKLGGTIAGFLSDRRLKSNVKRVGTHSSGLAIYEYDIFGWREQGFMADEVQKVIPEAVHRGPDGYLRVDYSKVI